MVKMVNADPKAIKGETTTWQAVTMTKLRMAVVHRLVLVDSLRSLFLTAGSRANASTEADRSAKPSKAVGSLEAKQTEANRPALSDKALIPLSPPPPPPLPTPSSSSPS